MPDVPPDPAFRAAMEERVRREGWQALQPDLEQVDVVSAKRIEPRNVRRVIRALEVFHATGKPFSAWQSPEAPPVESVQVGLELERQVLFARLDKRIDAWLASGFVQEVQSLLSRGYEPGLPSMSSIGYREIAQALDGTLSLDEAVVQIKNATHQYAKRQMTWFSRKKHIHWLNARDVTAQEVVDLLAINA
jgi:tRNA dimethylallyltransferase